MEVKAVLALLCGCGKDSFCIMQIKARSQEFTVASKESGVPTTFRTLVFGGFLTHMAELCS